MIDGRAPRILVVDDDQTLLRTLVWILKDHGYEPVPLTGGEELLERMDNERPDLVMLDIMMPKVDGLQVLERLKEDERFKDIPVLMISSMPPEDATVKSLGLGANDFISKPFRVKELVARVDAHLRVGRELREARRAAKTGSELADILHEVTDSLKKDEIYHILARRVARALNIPKCSIAIAQPGDETALVVASYENPMLRNLEIELRRYPEIGKALNSGRPVLVTDVDTDPLYAEVRTQWKEAGIEVPTRSAIALPFSLKGEPKGVFFLRTTGDAARLTENDVTFASNVIKAAVAAIEKAQDLETAVMDRQKYQFLASTDALTGCLNRRAMLDRLNAELERARRYEHLLTVLMIDLDRFKSINDTRGHLVGDSVLKQIGEILKREARTVDVVARYGGEEFVLVLPDTDLKGGTAFAERLRAKVEDYVFEVGEGEEPLSVTISVGVSAFPTEGAEDANAIIALADAALYRAKNEGRNLVRT